jgi:hypothetical protein
MINRLADALTTAKTVQRFLASGCRFMANSCWFFGNSGVAPAGRWFSVTAMHNGRAAMRVLQ